MKSTVSAKSIFLDLIFPRKCLGCGILLSDDGNSYLCSPCIAAIVLKNSFACAFCKSQTISGKTCPFCRPQHFLDQLLVATSYVNPLVEKITKTMKYRFISSLAVDVASLMIKYLEPKISSLGLDNDLVVVPVPLHRLRLNWRGFNQSELIANNIANRFNFNFQANALARHRNPPPQAQIPDTNSRIENMNLVFKCIKPELVINRAILLIDDISTTSSTLDDCARALKSAGAKAIIGLVFARGEI